MDLLRDEIPEKKEKDNKGQKIVLTLLIICIILSFIVGGIIAYLQFFGVSRDFSIAINGQPVILDKIGFFADEAGNKYVSLKKLAGELGFKYYNGEYNVAGENKNMGYIDNGLNIVQFYDDSKTIFKTEENSLLGYEFYELDEKIFESNDNLYINLEEVDMALNVMVSYSSKTNQTSIQTPQDYVERNLENLKKNEIELSTEKANLRAMAYGYAVITQNGKTGVINLKGEEIIGNKYNSVEFNEYTNSFIVSNIEKKYGVITPGGLEKISLYYDGIEILSYKPLLYKVKKLNKYGILRGEGTSVGEIKYERIAYPENRTLGINYTLFVPELNENIPESVVVCSEGKYGLLNLEKGTELLPCSLDGIYSVSKEEKDYYVVEYNETNLFLEDYIREVNRITVTVQ